MSLLALIVAARAIVSCAERLAFSPLIVPQAGPMMPLPLQQVSATYVPQPVVSQSANVGTASAPTYSSVGSLLTPNQLGHSPLFSRGAAPQMLDRAAIPWGYVPSSRDYIEKNDTSGRLIAALKTKVFQELGIDPKAWLALEYNERDSGNTPAWLAESNSDEKLSYWTARNKAWNASRKEWLAGSQKREFDQRMGIEMVAALREEVLLTDQHAPKKRLCVFDFDGTLTEDYAGVTNQKLLGSAQRVAALRHFLETLHADSHLAVCSFNSQDRIVATLRAAKLLDLFDVVVDRNHINVFDWGSFKKGRALQELLLPLFPSVGGSEDVLFVDDDSRNIDDLQKTAPDCTTFMCERNTGLTIADMDFLLAYHTD